MDLDGLSLAAYSASPIFLQDLSTNPRPKRARQVGPIGLEAEPLQGGSANSKVRRLSSMFQFSYHSSASLLGGGPCAPSPERSGPAPTGARPVLRVAGDLREIRSLLARREGYRHPPRFAAGLSRSWSATTSCPLSPSPWRRPTAPATVGRGSHPVLLALFPLTLSGSTGPGAAFLDRVGRRGERGCGRISPSAPVRFHP